MEEKFNIFVPFDSIEKATDKKTGKEIMKVGGVISNELTGEDLDGEVLEVGGMDFQKFLTKGFINFHHLATKDPSSIIGEPVKAYTKDGKAYVEGILYPESEMAQKVYQLAKTLEKSSSTRRLGYSIEGKALLRDPLNPKRIKKSAISGLAITPAPKCDGTELMILKGGDVQYEKQKDSEYLIDITDDRGVRWTVDSDLNIEKGDRVEKAMVAGSVTGTDTTDQNLTQEPLKKESVEGKKKKKKIKSLEGKSELTKAETMTMLVNEFNLDLDSCKNVWGLIERIEKNITR